MSTLTKKRLRAGAYELVDESGRAVVRIDKTGVDGRDTYPWDYYFLVPVAMARRSQGTAATLAEAIDEAGSRWAQYGPQEPEEAPSVRESSRQLLSLMKAVRSSAKRVHDEVVYRDDLPMAEGHAILLQQQATELRQSITDQIKAQEGAPS